MSSKFFKRGASGLLAVVTVAVSVAGMFYSTPASAAGEQIVMGMPFAGKWAYNVPTSAACGTTAHPSCHELYGYQWGVDYYVTDGTAVKMHGASAQGAVTFTSTILTSGQSCGQGVKVTAKANGVSVGEVYVTHLNGAVAGTNMANESSIGTVRNECYGVDHVHFNYKNLGGNNACYKNYSTPTVKAGMDVAYGAVVGVLGSTNIGVQQECANIPDTNPGPPPPLPKSTSSSDEAPFGGDFNGDGYGDTLVIHKHANDNGADIHALFGSPIPVFNYNPTYIRTLSAPTWDWNKMKFTVGRFNSDSLADLAIFYERDDYGANVHVLYGATGPGMPLLTDSVQRYMPGPDWNWSLMKLVSGDFDGDGYDDITVGHKQYDNGIGLHVLRGGVGVLALNNSSTAWRSLSGSAWSWNNAKLAGGPFNADRNADLVIAAKRDDNGVGVHIFNGGVEQFGNATTWLRDLPGPNYVWSKIKLAAGQFNSDPYADVAVLHQQDDGGIGVHALYGNPVPFQNPTTAVRSLASPWNWADVKLVAGPFDNNDYGDVALLHRNGVGMDAHVLFGGVGTAGMFTNTTTNQRSMPSAQGWQWLLSWFK